MRGGLRATKGEIGESLKNGVLRTFAGVGASTGRQRVTTSCYPRRDAAPALKPSLYGDGGGLSIYRVLSTGRTWLVLRSCEQAPGASQPVAWAPVPCATGTLPLRLRNGLLDTQYCGRNFHDETTIVF